MAGPQQSGFDVNAARSAGYSDDEILQHLTETRNYDVNSALQSGYSKSDVINYLSGSQPTPPKSFWTKVKEAVAPRAYNQVSGFVPRQQGTPEELPGVFEGHPENMAGFVDMSGGEMVRGAKDIAQGNIAKGGHRIIQGAGAATVPLLPFLGPTVAVNPALALRVAAGGVGGSFIGQKGAEAFGATPDQQALAGDIGGLVGGYGAGKLPSFLSKVNPSALKAGAGQAFNAVRDIAGSNAVDVEGAGQAALSAKELQDVGRTMPRTMQKFLQRVTAPDAEPLTYKEARDFYSAASEISANERNNLTPAMQKALNDYRRALGGAIQQTADNAGVGTQYGQAMTDYAKAKRLEDTWGTVWGVTKKRIIPAALGGGAAAAGYKIYKDFAE